MRHSGDAGKPLSGLAARSSLPYQRRGDQNLQMRAAGRRPLPRGKSRGGEGGRPVGVVSNRDGTRAPEPLLTLAEPDHGSSPLGCANKINGLARYRPLGSKIGPINGMDGDGLAQSRRPEAFGEGAERYAADDSAGFGPHYFPKHGQRYLGASPSKKTTLGSMSVNKNRTEC